MRALDAVVREHIAPLLTAHGFTRKRRRFSLSNAAGDLATVDIHQYRHGDKAAEFLVDLHVLPKIWGDHIADMGINPSFVGLWRDQVQPGPWRGHWALNPSDEPEAAYLEEKMEAQLPEMLRMLDPASFLDYVRLPVRESNKVVPRRQAVRAVLLAAQGPSDELEQQLRELGTEPRWAEFDAHTVAFVRRRLAARE